MNVFRLSQWVCGIALFCSAWAGPASAAQPPTPDSAESVRYRARLPIPAAFVSAEHDEIAVHRVIPPEAAGVRRLSIHVRLATIDKPGHIVVEVGGESHRVPVKSGDWIVRADFDTPRSLAGIREGNGDVTVRVRASDGIRIGRFDFDSSPRARWARQGEDGEHYLYAVIHEVLFDTQDAALRQAGFLELPDLPRERPTYEAEAVAAESVEAFPSFVRGSVNLNGRWELASSPPDQAPSTFPASVVVPGIWTGADGVEHLDGDIHSLWYRREFFVPRSESGADPRLVLHFQQVSFKASVYVNGVMVGSHLGDLEPFEFDVTDHVVRDQVNEVLVCVEDHTQHFTTGRLRSYLTTWRIAGPDQHLPAFGMTGASGKAYMAIPGDLTGETDGASKLVLLENGKPLGPGHNSLEDIEAYGAGRYWHTMYTKEGKARPVIYFAASDNTDPRTNGRRYDILADVPVPPRLTQRLELLYPSAKLSNWTGILKDVELRIEPRVAIDDVFIQPSVRRKELVVDATVGAASAGLTVRHEVWREGERVLELPAASVSSEGKAGAKAGWADARLWDINDPYLYFLKSELIDADGRVLDIRWTRFGFREFWVSGTQFMLNGRPIRLQGDSPSIYHYLVPREHRWFESLRFEANRLLNHNFSRLHVGGINSPAFVESADETGMLVSLEPPYLPYTLIWDYEHDRPNPERLEIVRRQYEDWARRFRNHPSLVMYSLENEWWSNPIQNEQEIAHFTKQLKQLFKPLHDAVRGQDPTRPTTLHGARGAYFQNGVAWSPIVNIHYSIPPATWKQDLKRPVVIGEFSSEDVGWTHIYFNTMDAGKQGPDAAKAQYWSQTRSLRTKLAAQIDEYLALDVSGIMPYGLWRWFCPMPLDDPRLADGEQQVAVEFPAWSGTGQKFPTARIYRDLDMHNLTDPAYPRITQTPITDVMVDHFDPQPIAAVQSRPELVITVTASGRPVPGAVVVLTPAAHQGAEPTGVTTDDDGRAWFVTPEGGAYTAWIATAPDRAYRTLVEPGRVKEFGVVRQVSVDLAE